MAVTLVRDGLRVTQWDNDYFREFIRTNKFARYMGATPNAVVQVSEDLNKKAGDRIAFQLIRRLKGQGVSGAATLTGNEEKLDNRSHLVTVALLRNGVEIDNKNEQIKTDIDLRDAGRDSLKEWSMERLRSDVIGALRSIDGVAYESAPAAARNAWLANNADRVLFGAAKANAASLVHATALASIDATNDRLTTAAVSLMKRIAKSADPRIRPIRVKEDEEWFVLFAGSLPFRDLKGDAAMQQANREARVRGTDNPLFTDGDLVWDGVIIKEIEEIPVLSGVGASAIDVGQVFLCGAQAVGVAYAQRSRSVEDTPRDYGRLLGVGIEEIRGIEKLRFGTDAAADATTPKDHGVVSGFFAAVADA